MKDGCWDLFQGNFPAVSRELEEKHNKPQGIRFLEFHKNKSENLLLEPSNSVTTQCLSGDIQMEELECIPVLNCAYTAPRSCRLCTIQHLMLIFFIIIYICSSVHHNSRLKKSNEMQLYADIYLLLNYSTCFGHPSRPSSGVHKTVVTASGTDHTVKYKG